MESNRVGLVADLLVQLFSDDEMYRWIERDEELSHVRPHMQRTGRLAADAHDVASVLDRRGFLSASLFESLKAQRPRLVALIVAVETKVLHSVDVGLSVADIQPEDERSSHGHMPHSDIGPPTEEAEVTSSHSDRGKQSRGARPTVRIRLYFSDIFDVSRAILEEYGAFDISLASDLPLFIDPFLLFESDKEEYRRLHEEMIDYLRVLRDRAQLGPPHKGILKALYCFPEVYQNWLGYSSTGNRGLGLGEKFAKVLSGSLAKVFPSFGSEAITRGSHVEKLCLVEPGVGRDKISDLTTNLIKGFLAEYTQAFALQHIAPDKRKKVRVERAVYNATLARWMPREFELPYFNNDYVLLTPKDILTRDDTWICHADLVRRFDEVAESLPNIQLRAHLDEYIARRLGNDEHTKDEVNAAILGALAQYPEFLDYYIKHKEDNGEDAHVAAREKVQNAGEAFQLSVSGLITLLLGETDFFSTSGTFFGGVRHRVMCLKDIVEKYGGHKLFYIKGKPIQKEADLQVMLLLVWCGVPLKAWDGGVAGEETVDFKVSRTAIDTALVEFKVASNTRLEHSLSKLRPLADEAPPTDSLKVIFCFTDEDRYRVFDILTRLRMQSSPNVVLVDARRSGKPYISR